MKCRNCNHEIPNDSEFCPFCGGAVEQGNACPKCGQLLPEESAFCPFCGNKLQSIEQVKKDRFEPDVKNEEKSTIKKAPKKKIILGVVVAFFAIAIIAGGFFGLNAFYAKKHLAAEEYTSAAACFDRILVAERIYPGEYELAKAGKSFENGDSTSFSFYTKLAYISRQYSNIVPKETKDRLTKSIYNTAVKWYNAGNYGSRTTDKDTAFQYFNAVDPYKDSSDYLVLLNAMADNIEHSIGSKMYATTENVIKLIDFQNAKEVLVSNDTIAFDFLTGSWKTSDNNYYFKVEDKNNQISALKTIEYNIPYFEMDEAYIGVIDGHVILYSDDISGTKTAYSQGDYKLLFDISVVNAQQITVYSYKSDTTYTLFRE